MFAFITNPSIYIPGTHGKLPGEAGRLGGCGMVAFLVSYALLMLLSVPACCGPLRARFLSSNIVIRLLLLYCRYSHSPGHSHHPTHPTATTPNSACLCSLTPPSYTYTVTYTPFHTFYHVPTPLNVRKNAIHFRFLSNLPTYPLCDNTTTLDAVGMELST